MESWGSAKFVVQVRGYTVDDADMVCLDIFIDFVSRSSSMRYILDVFRNLS